MLYNLAATLSSVPAGRASDRTGTTRVLSFGVTAFALSYLGFSVGGSTVLGLAPWFVLAGVGIGFVETSESAAVANLASSQIRASAFGVLAAVQSLGNFVASSLVGFLWSATSPRAAFVYVAVCMMVSLGAIGVTSRSAAIPPRRPG